MLRWGIFVFFLAGCGTYRTSPGYQMPEYRGQGGEYQGVGKFKPPSDYSGADVSEGESADAHARLGQSGAVKYTPTSAFHLYWPVDHVRVNRGFHPPSDPRHEGIDLGGKRGVPILAAHEGLVIYAGNGFSGYGRMVILEYSGEWATLYGHLDSIAVREGMILHPGDPVGTMGATGHATGVHLHFELMHRRVPVDPLPLLTSGKRVAEQEELRVRQVVRFQRGHLSPSI